MNGKTHAWFFSTVLFVPLLYADSQYECGAHGRFEYCIDGIPGCVIGCHCHPGYYFDTDTKICEPNIKLSQDFRRNYLLEPTRVHVASNTRAPEEQTSPSAIDKKVDEITKDADDLGDWLYNQFFKTIENQVINKTQGEELPTRRSGKVLIKPERRSHKYWRGRKKKKKKSKGMKSKLLSITEDDSLFDSDSSSASAEDRSSSSESDESTGDKRVKNKDRDHDHKKIIIFNKKPQPPLPSFIFLPNMDTPFYPPIGLPPPPAMPMYPMVPVPPMLPGLPIGGPLFPYPGTPQKCEDETNTAKPSISSTESTTSSTKSSTSSTESSSTTSTESSTTTSTESSTTISTESSSTTLTESTTLNQTSIQAALRHRKRKRKPIRISNNEQGIQYDMRNKLFKKLREKLNRKNKIENYFVDQYQNPESPMEINDPSASLPTRDHIGPSMNDMPPQQMDMPPQQDVDFKYLAELIHKADLNKTLNNKPNLNNYIPENVVTPNRRYYDPINNKPAAYMVRQKSRMEEPNDAFYTDLGKQIATMIRKIDSNGEREVNIEIEGADTKSQTHTSPVFNENNYAARSYWERSVRSPLTYLGTFKKEMDYLKESNENLFSLENKVALAASTTRTLSLHDLENIISTVNKVRVKPKRNNVYKKIDGHSNASFKLNLLPRNVETTHTVRNIKPVQSFANNPDTINKQNTRRKQADPSIANSFLLSNFRHLSPNYDDLVTKTQEAKESIRTVRPTRKPTVNNSPLVHAPPTHLMSSFIPPFSMKERTSNIKYDQSHSVNKKKFNYYNNNQNQYLFKKTSPIQFTGLTKSWVPYGKFEKPSYFHHEFHHFDFFDI